ncbi:hypothetical protein BGW36DRAFT_292428 [Talaromyces proteolyticus]|uniref:RNA polymerase Rpb1 C-terminal repeat domain-containing protein n=1 Tax=Talaromyces proteolyticus TaxID=1131652 RepID=A0AAD4PYE6_9EURO|nr:uncharacterized protein BGW36DRAFT_292428 [Talaromyces proteolyticus]KAH8701090.1 hypothetical protein BGW36DRAFT_292428 [Talaromyces proteolyticus]
MVITTEADAEDEKPQEVGEVDDTDPSPSEELPRSVADRASRAADEESDYVDWEQDEFEETEKILDELEKVLEDAQAQHEATDETEKAKEEVLEEPADVEQHVDEATADATNTFEEDGDELPVETAGADPEPRSIDEPAEIKAEVAKEPAAETEDDVLQEDPVEPEHFPEEPEADLADERLSKYSNKTAHPPAPMPLPSPVPSEPRSIHSPGPEHPLSRHGSPLVYHASPTFRHSTPHMHPYGPHMMAMNGPPHPPPMVMNGPHPHPHPFPPPMHPGSIATSSASFATAYHSPVIDQGPIPPSYAYARRQSGISNAGFYNGRMDRTLSGGSSHSHNHRSEKANGQTNGQTNENSHEHHHLMGRIEKVMPDITRLLDSFKDTQGKLQAREAETRQLQSQHEQAIMHKDFYIEALQNQMKKAAMETAEEYTKLKNVISELRLELGNQQEKVKDLEECLDVSRKENDGLQKLKIEAEGEIQSLQNRIEELQLAHERALEEAKEHERTELSSQREELTNLFEEIRAEDENTANDRYNEREKELLDEKEALKSAWEEEKKQIEEAQEALKTELDSAQSDLQESRNALSAKKETLEAKENELESTKAELESKLTELKEAQDELASTKIKLEANQIELESTKAELNSTIEELTSKQSELEDKHREIQETHEQHAADKEQLTDSHSAELDTLRDTHSTELDGLRSTHEAASKEAEDRYHSLINELEEKQKAWDAKKFDLEKLLTEKTDELMSLEREKDSLERDDVAREKQLQSAVDEMRRTIDNMESDREKLRKTLQSLGEATDLKTSKGDQFFMDSFGQLRKLIVELSKDHFSYLPIDPPKDILEKIPPEMPSFLDNTLASRELRAAYIQHVVSKTLTYRVFQPFLFTLGRRYDKADTFFQVLSMDIRRKSVRREAFWRQQTLKAAYTTSDAKQSINVVAAVIVDEIVDHIKHFADPKQLDALLIGIRRIVKLAAETWRHARVERELVLATMPAPESDGVSNDDWDEYTCGRDTSGCPSSDNTRFVLLRVFPRIYREAAHEDLADDKERVNACVYSPGTVLYSDSPSVLARREELGRKSPIVKSAVSNGVEEPRALSRTSGRKSPVSV